MVSSSMARAALMAALACSVPCILEDVARAEATAADKETARRLMAEARDKRTACDLKAALQSFIAADAIMKVPTTGLEVARTQAAIGLLVEARDTALRVARSQPEPDEPAPFTKAREEATSISEDLVKRIPTLTVQVAGGEPGASPNVTVDGAAVPAASLGMPRTVNPGHHVIAATDGKKQGRADVDIGEAQHKDVRVELAGAAPPPAVAPEAPATGAGPGKAMMIGGGIVAVLGIGVGSVTGVMSLSKTSSVKNSCNGNSCPASEQSNIDSAQTLATVSTVSFVAGGVGAVVSLVGFLMWRGEAKVEEKSASGATVQPWIGLGSAGVSGAF